MRNHVVEVVNEIGVRLVALEDKMDKIVAALREFIDADPVFSPAYNICKTLDALPLSTHQDNCAATLPCEKVGDEDK